MHEHIRGPDAGQHQHADVGRAARISRQASTSVPSGRRTSITITSGCIRMTSVLKNVDQAIARTVGTMVDDAFKGGDNVFSLKDNATGYGAVGAMVPPSIIAQINAQAHLIAAGKIVPTTVIPATLQP